MKPLLAFSRVVDDINTRVGRIADWLTLIAVVVSAGNAFVRYGVSWSSNALLEVQWYFFAGMVMLGAPYTLLRNEHVRVDILYGSMGERARLWVDILGIIVFLLPAMALLTWMTWPFFWDSFVRGEGSQNAGGLLRWPVKILMPLGFLLITLQGLSELIKRVALLRGLQPDGEAVTAYERPLQ
jgi:TRAP-type mannitol/chloroaromatic compound transport system permease small subunit